MQSKALVLLAALAAAGTHPCMARDFSDAVPHASAYLTIGFGGAARSHERLKYGFRLDRFRPSEARPTPPILAFDFSASGFQQAVLGGIPFTSTNLMLSQTEGVESPGWAFWDWGLPQWGMVLSGGIMVYTLTSYEDPYESDPAAEPPAQEVVCGDDVEQPVFGEADCIDEP